MESFYEKYIEPGMGCFAIIGVVALIILALNLGARDYDRTHDSFETVYAPTGIFENHEMSPLGPNEITGLQFHGNYFGFLTLNSGSISGSSTETLILRFKWQAPDGAWKVKEYPYEKVNFYISEEYAIPEMKLVFTKDILSQQLEISYTDHTVYDFNTFFGYTTAINIYLDQSTYDSEMSKLILD